MKKYKKSSDIPDSEIPDNFDWRNFKGYDFTGDVLDQRACGSCYTFSFVQIAQSRLKLKYGKQVPTLSAQQAMTCNYMNEGCEGGWPILHGYFFEQAHLVSEQCAPYLAQTKGEHCSAYESCEPIAKVKSANYVGKGYGDATEKAMMKEIMHSGLIEGEAQWPRVASFYKSGVLTGDGLQQLHGKVMTLA